MARIELARVARPTDALAPSWPVVDRRAPYFPLTDRKMFISVLGFPVDGRMHLRAVRPFPMADAAFPGLGMTVACDFDQNFEAILSVHGWVASADNKLVGPILPRRLASHSSIPLSAREVTSRKETGSIEVECFVPLARESIRYIEGIRMREKKKDVILSTNVYLNTLVSKAKLSHLSAPDELNVSKRFPDLARRQEFDKAFLTTYKYDRDYSSSKDNMWILSGEGGTKYLEFASQPFSSAVTISASDWVQDYAPLLGLGRFVSVELPLPEELELSPTLREKFDAARRAIAQMEEDFKRGDWPELLDHARPVPELFREQNYLRDAFEAEGYPADAIAEFRESLSKLFDFLSKFHHAVDRQGKVIPPRIRPSREEAEIVYALCVTIVNLLARTAKRASQES